MTEQIHEITDEEKSDFTRVEEENRKDSSWESPCCLEKDDRAPFPTSIFPKILANFIRNVANSRQVPEDLPGLLALGIFSGASSKKFRIYIGNTHSEPMNLYIVCCLDVGERKSPVFCDMRKPFDEEQVQIFQNTNAEFIKAKNDFTFKTKRIEELARKAAKEEKTEQREKWQAEAAELSLSLREPVRPELSVGGDVTPETLASKICEQGGKISMFDVEGGFFEIINGRYSDGRGNLDVVLKAHSGADILQVSRRNREECVEYPALTMVFAIQPAVVKDFSGKKGFRSRGLLGRFLYSIPASLRGSRTYKKEASIDEALALFYKQAVSKLLNINGSPSIFPDKAAQEAPLRITGKALDCWTEIHDKYEAQLGPGGDLEDMADWANKLAGHLARIAGILHVIDHIETGTIPSEISSDAVSRAGILGDYLCDHARQAFGLMKANPLEAHARKILDWTLRKGKSVFTLRDVDQAYRAQDSIDGVKKNLSAIQLLVSREILRPCKNEESARGAPPKNKFELNPKCKECAGCKL